MNSKGKIRGIFFIYMTKYKWAAINTNRGKKLEFLSCPATLTFWFKLIMKDIVAVVDEYSQPRVTPQPAAGEHFIPNNGQVPEFRWSVYGFINVTINRLNDIAWIYTMATTCLFDVLYVFIHNGIPFFHPLVMDDGWTNRAGFRLKE